MHLNTWPFCLQTINIEEPLKLILGKVQKPLHHLEPIFPPFGSKWCRFFCTITEQKRHPFPNLSFEISSMLALCREPSTQSNTCINKYLRVCSVTQSCPTLCDHMDCSLRGASVHGIFQARTLEWVAVSFSRRSSQPRDWTWSFLCVQLVKNPPAMLETWVRSLGWEDPLEDPLEEEMATHSSIPAWEIPWTEEPGGL